MTQCQRGNGRQRAVAKKRRDQRPYLVLLGCLQIAAERLKDVGRLHEKRAERDFHLAAGALGPEAAKIGETRERRAGQGARIKGPSGFCLPPTLRRRLPFDFRNELPDLLVHPLCGVNGATIELLELARAPFGSASAGWCGPIVHAAGAKLAHNGRLFLLRGGNAARAEAAAKLGLQE